MISTPKKCGKYNCKTDHRFHIKDGDTMLTLVGTGRRAYIHIAFSDAPFRASAGVGNGRTLALLAAAILKEGRE